MSPRGIQEALQLAGYYHGKIDGDLGELSVAAIKHFQADHGLLVDGVAGPKTQSAMQIVTAPENSHAESYNTISNNGLIALAHKEALVLSSYKDSKGIWTIAIGHTESAGDPNPVPGLTINTRDALEIFRRDLLKFQLRVNKAITVPLKQHEFDALVSFDFNTGGINKAKLTKCINAGDRAGALAGFMGWLTPPELYGRRLAEQKLFAVGDYGDLLTVPVMLRKPGSIKAVPVAEIFH